MHHLLFEHQRESAEELDDDHLVRYAVDAGADARQVMTEPAGVLPPAGMTAVRSLLCVLPSAAL